VQDQRGLRDGVADCPRVPADWQLGLGLTEAARQIIVPQDLLQPGMAENVAREYLNDSRIKRERAKDSPIDPEWVELRETGDGQIREEHAHWITSGADLDHLLGNALTRSHVITASGTSARRLNRLAVLESGKFVAVVDEEGRFQYLLHREAIVEQLASEAAERDTDSE
jgi:hypothetical protein